MPNAMVYIREGIYEKYRRTQNKSSLINDLLEKYYQSLQHRSSKEQIKKNIIMEAMENMEYEDKMQPIREFVENMTDKDREEYKQGIVDDKWRSVIDYAKIKLKPKTKEIS